MTSLEKSRMSLVGRVGDEQFFFMIVFCKNFPTSKIIISLESHKKKSRDDLPWQKKSRDDLPLTEKVKR